MLTFCNKFVGSAPPALRYHFCVEQYSEVTMKTFKVAALALAALSGIAVATAADAHGRGRGHVGIWFGAPLFPYYAPYYPPAYYPRYYYPPAVVVPPPVYIEQAPPAAPAPAPSAQSSGAYWYYCRDTQTYYPYVQQCATPWQQVIPQSSAPPS